MCRLRMPRVKPEGNGYCVEDSGNLRRPCPQRVAADATATSAARYPEISEVARLGFSVKLLMLTLLTSQAQEL